MCTHDIHIVYAQAQSSKSDAACEPIESGLDTLLGHNRSRRLMLHQRLVNDQTNHLFDESCVRLMIACSFRYLCCTILLSM